MRKIAVLGATLACVASSVPAQPPAFDPAPIEQATGIKPTYNAKENVYKVTRPRPNLAAVDGWKLPPFLGTSSYAAFAPTGEAGKVMVMGDNVLYEDEVPAAMDAALQNGLDVTALHNHFFFEQPRLYFMHVGGMGATGAMAAAVRKVLDAPQRIRAAHATPAATYARARVPAASHISAAPLDAIFGKAGESNILETELQAVLKSLRGAGIQIVAIHQHMTGEEPRLMFLHYWGQGKAQDLAKAVRAAIDLTGTTPRTAAHG
jgi:hypothetical protein